MKRRILICLFSITLAVFSHSAQAADLKIATMRLGTSWYVFGATLYQLLKPEVPKGTRVEVIAKGGGIGNPITVSSGKAAIGLSNVITSKWAYDGHPDIYRGKKQSHIRALAGGLNPVWFTALVREDYIKKTGNDTLDKIFKSKKPVRIVMKPRGSTVPVIADLIFDSLDTNRKTIQANGGRILQVDSKQIPSIIRDGRADLYLDAVPLGHPTVTEVSLTGKIRFLALPNRTIDFLSARGLIPSVIPKTYKGQSAPTPSVDLGTIIIANSKISEDLAYIVTKTVCENADAMAKAHKAWNSFNPSTAWKPKNTGIPLHKGAIRYYREKGWMEN
jgi:uncharacterized protein